MNDNGGGNDNNDNNQQQQQPQPQRPLLQLIDEEEWFNLYGLRQACHYDEAANENASDRETANNVASELSYQKKIHAKIFEEEDREAAETTTTTSETKQMLSSLQQLERWKEETIDIPTTRFPEEKTTEDLTDTVSSSVRGERTTTVVIRANLGELAARSDTVFAMASNQHLFGSNGSANSSSSGSSSADNNIRSRAAKQSRLSLSLHEYSTESVKIFLEVLLSPSSPQTTTTTLSSQTTDSSEPFTDILIPPENVIDCCRLAHYLQCQQLLDSIVDDYLMAPGSIDDTNCRFLCKLADELSLPGLWEASVNHMLSSLDKFDDTNNNDNGNDINSSDNNSNENEPKCLWGDLSQALKTEIQALRGILRSSNRKKVYFSTYHEYLGLLAEQHQYYRERLEDAKQGLRVRSEDESKTRAELSALEAQKASNGWYGNSRLDKRIENTKRMLEGLSKGRKYAASKIERQERRVQTLKALWEEQKKIFGGGSQCDEYSPGEHRSNPAFERGRM